MGGRGKCSTGSLARAYERRQGLEPVTLPICYNTHRFVTDLLSNLAPSSYPDGEKHNGRLKKTAPDGRPKEYLKMPRFSASLVVMSA